MTAISSEHSDVALNLLLKGCTVNCWYKTETDELQAVHIAAAIGDRNMVKTLIEHKDVTENICAKWEGEGAYNLLHFACRYGHFELASYLLIETETNVSASTTNGKMPIDLAMENKHGHIYKLLMNGSYQPGYMIDYGISTLKRTNSATSVSCSASTTPDDSVSKTFYSSVSSTLTIDEPYRMHGSPFGVAVIITNAYFYAQSGLSSRLGSSFDKERLEKSFRRLHLDVYCYNDLTADEIRDCLHHYSSRDNNDQSCFVCCISSHGKNGFVYGTDGGLVRIIDLTSMFTAGKAKNLSGKPKLFVVTACQGNKPGMGKMSYSEVVRKEEVISEKDIIPVPEGDFVVCYSTVPGQTSYRDVTDGTAFVRQFTENLNKYGEIRDIEEMLRNTTKHLGQNPIKTAFGERTQVCLTFTTLRRRFVLRESVHDKSDNSSVFTKTVAQWKRRQSFTTETIPIMVKKLSLVSYISTNSWNR